MKNRPVNMRKLSITTKRKKPGMICVLVKDAGKGIEEDRLEKIFTPFYTTKSSGLGMGLPISRSIVESHNGKLCVKRNSDTGMTFYFTLPIYKKRQRG